MNYKRGKGKQICSGPYIYYFFTKKTSFSTAARTGDAPFKAINALRRGTNMTADGFLVPNNSDRYSRAGHTRQPSRQSDTVIRQTNLSTVTLPPNIMSTLHFDSEQQTFFVFKHVTEAEISYRVVALSLVATLKTMVAGPALVYSSIKKNFFSFSQN